MDAGVSERLADRAEGVAALAQALDLVVEGEGLSGQTSRRACGQQRCHGFKDVQRVGKTGARPVCGSSRLGVGFAWACILLQFSCTCLALSCSPLHLVCIGMMRGRLRYSVLVDEIAFRVAEFGGNSAS